MNKIVNSCLSILDVMLCIVAIGLVAFKFKSILVTIVFLILFELIRNNIIIRISGISYDDAFDKDELAKKMIESQPKYIPWLLSLSTLVFVIMSFI